MHRYCITLKLIRLGNYLLGFLFLRQGGPITSISTAPTSTNFGEGPEFRHNLLQRIQMPGLRLQTAARWPGDSANHAALGHSALFPIGVFPLPSDFFSRQSPIQLHPANAALLAPFSAPLHDGKHSRGLVPSNAFHHSAKIRQQ